MWIYHVQDSALNDKYTEVKARRKKKKKSDLFNYLWIDFVNQFNPYSRILRCHKWCILDFWVQGSYLEIQSDVV